MGELLNNRGIHNEVQGSIIQAIAIATKVNYQMQKTQGTLTIDIQLTKPFLSFTNIDHCKPLTYYTPQLLHVHYLH